MQRILINILFGLAIFLMLLAANVWWRQQTQFQRGEQADKAGNFMNAITGYEYAIRMYTPASPTVELAAQRIWNLAEARQNSGDLEGALLAYRSLRSAFYATRWLRQPGTEWIARCNRKIAALAPLRTKEKP